MSIKKNKIINQRFENNMTAPRSDKMNIGLRTSNLYEGKNGTTPILPEVIGSPKQNNLSNSNITPRYNRNEQ